ncbi:PepSY domain-containing protein [Aquimarina addita]
MQKNQKLNKWLWKWHFIAGMVSLPFILILSITGIIYLFKADYEAPKQKDVKEVIVQGTPISLQEQWKIAKTHATKKPNAVIIPTATNQATEFVSGRFGGKSSLYVNPYTGEVSGVITPKDSVMFTVRKLHGELLLGGFGTKIVELIACWMIVLILTGIYVWWPGRGWQLKGFFIPRTGVDKRTFYRDLHSITGFWVSILLMMILAGGLPWTDVFGSNFKTLQKVTNTGYPSTWDARKLQSNTTEAPQDFISLDQMMVKATSLNLSGDVAITFPKGPNGVYSVSNTNPMDLASQKKVHFDAYTGKQLLANHWDDVGILMQGRMWFMAFHQGEFGTWNWVLMLLTSIALTVMSIAAIVSYVLRKKPKKWGVPKVPASFKVGYGIVVLLIILSVVFPLFGGSLIIIIGVEYWRKKRKIASI